MITLAFGFLNIVCELAIDAHEGISHTARKYVPAAFRATSTRTRIRMHNRDKGMNNRRLGGAAVRRGARGQPAEAATADGVRRAQGYEAKIMAPIRARFFADTWMFERHAPTPRSARGAHAAAARVSPSRAAARVAVDRRRSCCEKLGAGPPGQRRRIVLCVRPPAARSARNHSKRAALRP